MKLYKTVAKLNDGTTEKVWSGSGADAGKDRKYFNSDRKIKRDNIATEEVDVPTDKKGLISFLNSDNV